MSVAISPISPPPSRRVARLLGSGVAWGVVTSIALACWILLGLGGRDYYSADLSVRAYVQAHRVLRPSGPAGQSFGMLGTLLMLMPFAYTARKRVKALKSAGQLKYWLEVHLFCGVFGPVLVTFHTSFKFNGIISAAYWSMVLVMLSGFVGRYLYVRIPRSIRGTELTLAELDARADEMHQDLVSAANNPTLMEEIDAFEASVLPAVGAHRSLREQLVGDTLFGRRLRRFMRRLEAAGVDPSTRADVARLTKARVQLLRQRFHLERTRELFQLWHVFHQPLVYLLLAITALHVALALYMGYVPFQWS